MTSRSVMAGFRAPSGAEAYRSLEAGFDELAPTYEEDIGGNAVGVQMREVFRKSLRVSFPGPGFLFELGCGTGLDAIWLARRGAEILATDISQAMLDRVRERAAAEGLSERIRCRRLAAGELGVLVDDFGEGSFDGGYCHAGALNMEPEIGRVPDAVRRLLRPGGCFVCSVINKTSLFEILFYPLVLRPRKAFRRLGRTVPLPISRKAPLNRVVVQARFYSPADLARLFEDGFAVVDVQGLRIVLPPSNLTDEYVRVRAALLPLEALEARISRAPLLRSCGHHSIVTFARR